MDAGTQVSTPQPPKNRGGRPKLPPGTLQPHLEKFARLLAKSGDVARAYFITHPKCKSLESAKRLGSKLTREPAIIAFLAKVKAEDIGLDGDKDLWEQEVRGLAYSTVNLRKVPIKEKLLALRTLGEAKGYLGQKQAPQGIRATFNFNLGGKRLSISGQANPAALPPPEPQGITVDAEVLPGPTEDEDKAPKPSRLRRQLFTDDSM